MKVEFFPGKFRENFSSHLYLDDQKLIAGINHVSEDLKQHPDFNSLVKSGALKIVNDLQPKAEELHQELQIELQPEEVKKTTRSRVKKDVL